MLKLTNAVVPFDGDEIVIVQPGHIMAFYVDHSLANGDCTRVDLDDGTVFQVKESVDEIETMLEEK